jgi:hypothetical protein
MAHQGAGVKGLTSCASRVAVGVFSPEKSVDGRYMESVVPGTTTQAALETYLVFDLHSL